MSEWDQFFFLQKIDKVWNETENKKNENLLMGRGIWGKYNNRNKVIEKRKYDEIF